MKSHDIVKELQETPGTKDKEQVLLSAFMSGNREFFIGARLAYDPLIRFGVKNVPAIADDDLNPNDQGSFTFNNFIELTNRLRKRELTGNAARDAISEAALSCHGPTWNFFYRRILRKDLQCGCTDTLINKVLNRLAKNGSDPEAESLIIPIFECQLAKDSKDHIKKLTGKKLCDIKLDGVRLLTELNKETGLVTQYSRDGLPMENFTHIANSLKPLLDIIPESLMLDGEVVGNSFQELMTQLNRDKAKLDNAKLALFDIIPLKDFKKGLCPTSQRQRHAILSELQTSGLFQQFTDGKVFVIPKTEIDFDTDEGQQAFKDLNRQTLDLHYEGIMIKNPDAPYKCKRNDAWLKMKPKMSVTLQIKGFKNGDPDSKWADGLGSILGIGYEDEKKIVTYVSGFTDKEREEIWNNREKYMDMMMEVESDEGFTKNKNADEDTWSLRFPVFKGLRGTIPGQKL